MIDALYPIMGGMISKYVTQAIKEMMEKINEKIEQGLSVERYKRKVKARLTGVSETELLLEESSDATVQSIFVIHKETGLLIAEANLESSEIDDPHMVASMSSAIKDFVNDWISNQEESGSKEIQLLSYGDATLYIESAGSVYMIAFLDSEPDYEQRKEIHTFFANVVKKFSTVFQSFDGDSGTPQIEKIENMLHTFLNQMIKNYSKKTPRSKQKNPARLIGLLLVLLGIGYGGYLAKDAYARYKLEKEIFQKTGAKISLEEEKGKLYLKGDIDSLHTLYEIKSFLKKQTDKPLVNALYLPIEELDRKLSDQQQHVARLQQTQQKQLQRLQADWETRQKDQRQALQTVLEQRQKELIQLIRKEQHKSAQLSQKIEALQEKIDTASQQAQKAQERQAKIDKLLSLHQRLTEKLREAFSSNSLLNSHTGTLVFKNKNLFEAGNSTANPELIGTLKSDIETYIKTLISDPFGREYIKYFVVKGYTDSSGSLTLNKKLSTERAEEIKRYILSLPFTKKYALASKIRAKGMANQDPVRVNGVEDKEASRRIEMTFELDKKKIDKAVALLLKK
jgi:outer membrane protein OmpA-like peptidoglycan-associated protein